jgi:ribosome maturation factor RimP
VAEVIRVVTCDRSETIAEIIERITGFRHVSGIEHGSPGVDRRLKSKRD